jgi:hypothetical protein
MCSSLALQARASPDGRDTPTGWQLRFQLALEGVSRHLAAVKKNLRRWVQPLLKHGEGDMHGAHFLMTELARQFMRDREEFVRTGRNELPCWESHA